MEQHKNFKTALGNTLFLVGSLSFAGSIGGLETGSLGITETILYLILSGIPIIFAYELGIFEDIKE